MPLGGFGIALLEVDLPVVNVKAGNVAIPVERDVIAQHRGEDRIGLHAIERAIEFPRNFAGVLQVGNVGLDPAGCVETRKAGGIGELRHG